MFLGINQLEANCDVYVCLCGCGYTTHLNISIFRRMEKKHWNRNNGLIFFPQKRKSIRRQMIWSGQRESFIFILQHVRPYYFATENRENSQIDFLCRQYFFGCLLHANKLRKNENISTNFSFYRFHALPYTESFRMDSVIQTKRKKVSTIVLLLIHWVNEFEIKTLKTLLYEGMWQQKINKNYVFLQQDWIRFSMALIIDTHWIFSLLMKIYVENWKI